MAGLLIVGTGPGIATSVARRFGASGMPVGLLARSQASIDTARATLAEAGVQHATGTTADAAREADLKAGLDRLVERQGVPEVVVYNAGLIQSDGPGDLAYEDHQHAYAINVLGAMTTAAHLGPAMGEAGGGTLVITGGMPDPVASRVSLSLGKAAVRALTSMLAQQYGPTGVHVATVTVAGPVEPGTDLDPDRIAEEYWRLHRQTPGAWEHEVLFPPQE